MVIRETTKGEAVTYKTKHRKLDQHEPH